MANKKQPLPATPNREAKIAKPGDFEESKTPQMELFELIHLDKLNREGQVRRNPYSNTIELYDFTPKYVWGKVQRVHGEFLRPIEREFICRGVPYKVAIMPARVKGKDGVYRDHFPSKREELLEDALRRLATRGQIALFDDRVGVKFSLNQLQEELAAHGHHYSITQIKEALLICGGTHLVITSADGGTLLTANLFENVGWTDKDHVKGAGKKTTAIVRFNMLVTERIQSRDYRLYNYETSMSYASIIARQLHKRMAHNHTSATVTKPFHISLTTLIRDFGLTAYADLRNNLRDVKSALEEMKEKNTILDYGIEPRRDASRRNALVDAIINIWPFTSFVADAVAANVRQQEVRALPDRAVKA